MAAWHPSTAALDFRDWSEALSGNPVVVVHVWAAWDRHDRDMDARLAAVRPAHEPDILFLSLDCDREDAVPLLRACSVINIPALICFVRSRFHETRVGLYTEQALNAQLRAWRERAGS